MVEKVLLVMAVCGALFNSRQIARLARRDLSTRSPHDGREDDGRSVERPTARPPKRV